jgi:voltage-dependent calcium channel L type alpha-1D
LRIWNSNFEYWAREILCSVGRPDTYLRDAWNNLDFIVVVTGFAELLPGGVLPNVSVIRTFRVLRPLKSVAGLDGVKMVLVAVTNSIPELMSIIVLLFFVFAIFGILGLQFFMGLTHSRCRLTPYPVTRDWVQGMDYSNYQCAVVEEGASYAGSDSNYDTMLQQPDWNKAKSIWSTPKDCYWPLDEEDDRLCSFRGSNEGDHLCASAEFYREEILPLNPDKAPTWCGSNWDVMGNPRFVAAEDSPLDIYGGNHTESGRLYTQEMLLWSANYVDSFQFGYIDFDHLGRGIVTIFQVITLEGWTDVMYMLQDVYNPLATAMFFVLFVVFGSFFVLNLLLAVLEQTLNW